MTFPDHDDDRSAQHNRSYAPTDGAAEFETKDANPGGLACMVVDAYSILVLRRPQDHDF